MTVYVANFHSNTVTPIDTATNNAGKAIPVGSHPDAIAITPDGKTAYVTGYTRYASSSVIPIRTAGETALPEIRVGSEPNAIAITPDGKAAYVTSFASEAAGEDHH